MLATQLYWRSDPISAQYAIEAVMFNLYHVGQEMHTTTMMVDSSTSRDHAVGQPGVHLHNNALFCKPVCIVKVDCCFQGSGTGSIYIFNQFLSNDQPFSPICEEHSVYGLLLLRVTTSNSTTEATKWAMLLLQVLFRKKILTHFAFKKKALSTIHLVKIVYL